MQAGQCGNQIDTQLLEVACNENGIGGDGEFCGDIDAQLDRINVLLAPHTNGPTDAL